MNHRLISRLRSISGSAVLAASSLFAVAMPASAGIDVDVTSAIPVVPPATSPSVSISVAPKEFFSTYNVKVTNNGPAVGQFFFFGYAIAQNLPSTSAVASATYYSSTGVACGPIINILFTLGCTVGPLAANEVKVFTVTFKTPSSGNALKFGWAGDHNLPPFDDQGSTLVTLTTDTASQVAEGFITNIPAGGDTKTFYTGVRPSGTGSPAGTEGSAATFGDPFTTTIIVPPIPVATTAEVKETVALSSCSPAYIAYGGCFESTLTIPVATFTTDNPLIIYLRIDYSRVKLGADINNAVIGYVHGTNPIIYLKNCTDMLGGVPASNVPCIAARQKYPSTSASAWKNDWEFMIKALDNGRFIN